MIEVQLSPSARADLVDIRHYSMAQFDADTADAYFLGFEAAFDRLSEHPHAGAATPQYGKPYRCLVHRKHRIFYTVEGERVLIVRILHHARNAKGMLGEAK